MPIENQADNQPGADYLISYPRSFVIITGNVSSAIFLSQLLSLSKNADETDGWVSKSMSEWEELTGMRRNEQSAARKNLQAINLLEEEVRGMPATLCFRLNHDELARLLPEANQFAENGNLFCNLVCSSEWVGVDTAESSANQFAENSKPLEYKACEAESHLQTVEQRTNLRIFAGYVSDVLYRLENKIGWVKNQIDLLNKHRLESNIDQAKNKTELLNEQGSDKQTQLDWMKYMLAGMICLLGMGLLILLLCIAIWKGQSDYQNHASPQKPVPMNNAPQNIR